MAKKRMSRQELKEPDQVLGALDRALHVLNENRKASLIAFIAVVVLFALWGVYRWRSDSQSKEAADLYKKGLRVYTAMIDPSLKTEKATKGEAAAYRSREERAKAALEIFSRVIKDHAGQPVARAAHLYSGNCHFELKQYDLAIADFKKVLGSSWGGCGGGCTGADAGGSDALKALALENLGYAQLAKGQYAEARKTFGDLRTLDKGARRDWSYYHEALVKEASGDLAGAIQSYEMVRQTGQSSKGQDPSMTFMLSPLSDLSAKRARYLKLKLEDQKGPPKKAAPAPAPDMAAEPAMEPELPVPPEPAMEPEPPMTPEPAMAPEPPMAPVPGPGMAPTPATPAPTMAAEPAMGPG